MNMTEAVSSAVTFLGTVWTFITGNWALVTIIAMALIFMGAGAFVSLFRGRG